MAARPTRRAFLRASLAPALIIALGGCARASTPTSVPATATVGTTPSAAPSPTPPATRPTTAVSSPTRPAAATATRGTAATSTRAATASAVAAVPLAVRPREYLLPRGAAPYGIVLTGDGAVWYTASRAGELGRLDPATGATKAIAIGTGAAPRGLTVGPDGALWLADNGLNAIIRVDPGTEEVRRITLPAGGAGAGLDALTFAPNGVLWFTGERGRYGRYDLQAGLMQIFTAPRGDGPGGIAATPGGGILFASFEGRYLGQIAADSGTAIPLDPPLDPPGLRRVASDARGQIWVSAPEAGRLALYDPATGRWRSWLLPGRQPRPRAVHVDPQGRIWISDDSTNAFLRFDPASEQFAAIALPTPAGPIHHLASCPGELWGAESGADRLVVLRDG